MKIRKIAKCVMLSCGVAIFLGAAQLALGQPADSTQFTESTTIIETGHLILDGEYIPPPYEITIEYDRVTINGRQYMEVYKPAPVPEVVLDSTSKRPPRFLDMLNDSFPIWLQAGGREYARQQLIDTVMAHGAYDSASFSGLSHVWLYGDFDPFDKLLLDLPLEPRAPIDYEGQSRKTINLIASTVKSGLKDDRLIITMSESGYAETFRNPQEKLRQIRSIIRTVSNHEMRVEHLQDVVGLRTTAEQISARFKVD